MNLTNTTWFWPALTSAGLLLALWAVEWLATRLAGRLRGPAAGWQYLATLLALLASVGALLSGLTAGLWQASAAGLAPPDWAAAAEWLPGYVAGMALWVGLLFYPAWQKWNSVARTRPSVVVAMARLVRDAALLAIWGAALTPVLGAYGAAWAALGLRLATRWWFPAGAQARREGRRPASLLHGALDVTATVVVIMTGSAWLALGARAVVYLGSALAQRVAQGPAPTPQAITEA